MIKKPCVLTILLTLLLSACASTSKNKERAEFMLRTGTAHLVRGNYPAALRDLLAAEKLDPRNPVVQNNLGLAYFVRDRYDLAETHIAKAIELDPKYSEARNNYGRVLIELARYNEAIRQLEIVTQDLTYQQPEKAWINMGLAHFRQGQFARARDKFAESIRIQRQSCLGQTYFGRSLLELGQYDRAAATLDAAVEFCKDDGLEDPQYFSGISYYKLGRTDKAVARMEEILRLYPRGTYAKKAEEMLKIMMK